MKQTLLVFLLSTLGAACHSAQDAPQKDKVMQINQPTKPVADVQPGSSQTEIATLGGGCFWCVEAVYQEMNGVLSVASGYSGGHIANPTYREICTGATGHAEVAQLVYDPAVVSFEEILEVFFTVHDPTTLNRQGNDVGTQYRSVIYYHNAAQKTIAEAAKEAASELWDNPVVTEISPLDKFYKAEEYHQNYYRNNPTQSYCVHVVGPKVQKFREKIQGET
ncbi:MAG: peptide-methionine (S)-S-oxide reductase MsrA [Lewinellaceae bacterium]|nr:peptide-methionine (S)-S-oxide reductase MsrA [Lewinellaceae bacterium]